MAHTAKYLSPSGRPSDFCYRYFCEIKSCDSRDIQISAGDIVTISKPNRKPKSPEEARQEFKVLKGNGGGYILNPQLKLENSDTGHAITAYANALVPVSKQRRCQTHAQSARAPASASSPAAAAAQSTPAVAPEVTLGEAPAAQAGAKQSPTGQFWSPSGQPSDYQYLYRCQEKGCLIRDQQVECGDKVAYPFLNGATVTSVISGNGGRNKCNPQVKLKDDSFHSVLDLTPPDGKIVCRFHSKTSSATVDVSPETRVREETEILKTQIVATIKQFEKQEESETERDLPKTLAELEALSEDCFREEANKFGKKSDQEKIFRRHLAIMTSKREQIEAIESAAPAFAMYKALGHNLIAIFTTARVISTGLIKEPTSTVSNVFSTLGTALASFTGLPAPAVLAISSLFAWYVHGKIKVARADAFRKILMYCSDQELAELIARRLCQRYINQVSNLAEDAENIALSVLAIMFEENFEVSKEFPLEDLAEQIVVRVCQLSAPTFFEKWRQKAFELLKSIPQGINLPKWMTEVEIIAIGPHRVFVPETSDLSSIPTKDWRYGTEAEALALELHEKSCKAEGFHRGHIFSMTEQEKLWRTKVDQKYDLLEVSRHVRDLTDQVRRLEAQIVRGTAEPHQPQATGVVSQTLEGSTLQPAAVDAQTPAESSAEISQLGELKKKVDQMEERMKSIEHRLKAVEQPVQLEIDVRGTGKPPQSAKMGRIGAGELENAERRSQQRSSESSTASAGRTGWCCWAWCCCGDSRVSGAKEPLLTETSQSGLKN
eukprot:TRINITY_DN430_c0_g1_i1.p1 TRINITY_DN430_c0_g1~~TRINITY_DN430_c0_g1_i1.p1  ORF type:complete len:775 (-),score=127.07 TRINITY_DN430_c0_g1_i1:43-2367(-)